jgi:hypothetical protein
LEALERRRLVVVDLLERRDITDPQLIGAVDKREDLRLVANG